ncbi:hypothetical protein JHK86_027471 [Glycine max]|nr:hypothetical protein JHK86_027471 [Glycine max]
MTSSAPGGFTRCAATTAATWRCCEAVARWRRTRRWWSWRKRCGRGFMEVGFGEAPLREKTLLRNKGLMPPLFLLLIIFRFLLLKIN